MTGATTVNAASGGGQLALPVTLADHATFDNFLGAGNERAVATLAAPDSIIGNALWLWGESGVGKSHLLQAHCAAHRDSAYLTADQLKALTPAALDGFERFARVCVDDVDRLLGDAAWERALFALYNALADRQGAMLVASRAAPRQVAFVLPDLVSRLRSGMQIALTALDDDGRLAALRLRAALRGVELPDRTGRYLLSHYRRDMVSLCALLDQLDLASLAARRKLTVPFVRAQLAAPRDGGSAS